MLVLVCVLAGTRYALPCRQIVEVTPWVPLRAVPRAPRFVAGLLTYRGEIVPVIDLAELVAGVPVVDHVATRIIVVRTVELGLVGLAAEQVTDTAMVPANRIRRAPIHLAASAYLGGVFHLGPHDASGLVGGAAGDASGPDGELIQIIEVDQLVPARMRELLAAPPALEEGGR